MRPALGAAAALAVVLLTVPAGADASTVRLVPAGRSLTLSYTAAGGEANRLELAPVAADAAAIGVSDPGAVVGAGAGCLGVDDHTAVCSPRSLSGPVTPVPTVLDRVAVALGDGADGARSRLSSTVAVTLLGQGGPDALTGGDGGDALAGGAGADRVTGGAGDDVIREDGRDGPDAIDGGPGRDRVDYGRRGTRVSIDLSRRRGADRDALEGVEDVTGGRGNDRLAGDVHANELRGGPGADVLMGRRRPDTLVGGPGFDRLYGGDGRDRLDLHDAGRDRATCGRAFDVVRGPTPPDRLANDCERALLERGGVAVLVSQPLRAQRSSEVFVRLTDPGTGPRFRGRVALRYRGVLLGRPSATVSPPSREQVAVALDIVRPAFFRLRESRRLTVAVLVGQAAFTTVLRAPGVPPRGTGGTPG